MSNPDKVAVATSPTLEADVLRENGELPGAAPEVLPGKVDGGLSPEIGSSSPAVGGPPDAELTLTPDGGSPTPDGGHPDEELVPAKRVRDLQSANDKLRAQLARLDVSMTEKAEQIEALGAGLAAATERYRLALQAANPDLPQELLTGSSIQELDEALERGQAIIDQVKANLAKAPERNAVPIGAPARTEPDWSTLSPKEKILRGMR